MSKYTQEQYDQLPDFVQNNLEKVGDEWTDKGLLKVKQTANDLNSQLEAERQSRGEIESKLSDFEKEKQAAIEAAKAEALEQARSKGDVEAIEKRYQEQMADLEERTTKRVREETLTEVQKERDVEKASNQAKSIAQKLAVDDDAADPLFELIKNRVKFEKGEQIFLASDGSATTMKESEFIEAVKTDPRYKYLIKANQTTKSRSFVKQNSERGSAENPRSNFMNSKQSIAERAKVIQKRMDSQS